MAGLVHVCAPHHRLPGSEVRRKNKLLVPHHHTTPPPPHLPHYQVLCSAAEYDELPVRHNEDKLNAGMAEGVRLAVDMRTVDDPHTKAHLLLQVWGVGKEMWAGVGIKGVEKRGGLDAWRFNPHLLV